MAKSPLQKWLDSMGKSQIWFAKQAQAKGYAEIDSPRVNKLCKLIHYPHRSTRRLVADVTGGAIPEDAWPRPKRAKQTKQTKRRVVKKRSSNTAAETHAAA